MGITTYLNGATLGIFLTTAATVVCGFGIYSEAWWKDGTGRTYNIFTAVNCTDVGCALSNVLNEGWYNVSDWT